MKSVKSLATMILMGVPIWVVFLGAFQLDPTSIRIHVDEPGVTVFIDNFSTLAESRTVGPIDIRPGEYRVKVVHDGVPVYSEVVRVASGEEAELWAHWLARESASLSRSVPTITAEDRALEGHFGSITGLGLSRDGDLLHSAAADGTLRTWGAGTGEAIESRVAHQGAVSGLSMLVDGGRFVTAGDDGLIKVWDGRTNDPLRTLAGEVDSAVRSFAASSDGRFAALGLVSGELRTYEMETGRELSRKSVLPHGATALAFSPDGETLVVSLIGPRPGTHRVEVWDTRSARLRRTLEGHSGPVWCLAFLPDGRRVLTGGTDRTLRLWDVHDGREIARLNKHPGAVFSVAVSPDGRRALAGTSHLWDGAGWSDADAYGVLIWDLPSRTPVGRLETRGPVRALAITPDGRSYYAGGEDRVVYAWSIPPEAEPIPEAPQSDRGEEKRGE